MYRHGCRDYCGVAADKGIEKEKDLLMKWIDVVDYE